MHLYFQFQFQFYNDAVEALSYLSCYTRPTSTFPTTPTNPLTPPPPNLSTMGLSRILILLFFINK